MGFPNRPSFSISRNIFLVVLVVSIAFSAHDKLERGALAVFRNFRKKAARRMFSGSAFEHLICFERERRCSGKASDSGDAFPLGIENIVVASAFENPRIRENG